MQDRTIDNALLALRRQIIREDREGLEHVEALLRLRGVRMPVVLPGKRPDAAQRGHMRRMVLRALQECPRGQAELSACVAARRPEIDADAAYHRVSLCLARLKREGLVSREGRVWLNTANVQR